MSKEVIQNDDYEHLDDFLVMREENPFDCVRPNIDYDAKDAGRRLSSEDVDKVVDYVCWIHEVRESNPGLKHECVSETLTLAAGIPLEDLRIILDEVDRIQIKYAQAKSDYEHLDNFPMLREEHPFDCIRPNIDYDAKLQGRRLSKKHRNRAADYVVWLQNLRDNGDSSLKDFVTCEALYFGPCLPDDDLRSVMDSVNRRDTYSRSV